MIARIWSGRTCRSDSDEYLKYLLETGVHDCAATDGNRGVFVLRRDEEEEAEFLFLSIWDSLESIRSFAGPSEAAAVYYPEDRRFLRSLSPTVSHFEVAFSTPECGRAQDCEAGDDPDAIDGQNPPGRSWMHYWTVLR